MCLRFRDSLPLAALLACFPVPGTCATSGALLTPDDMPELPTWTYTTSVSLAAGYRDNILLSPTSPEGAALIRGEFEVMALKVPVRAWDGHFYVNAVESRFLSAAETDHERTVLVSAQARWQPAPSWTATLAVRGYHHDQVFDVSATEVQLATALLKLTGFSAGPAIRWTRGRVWLEAAGTYRQDHYTGGIDGYEEGEGSLQSGLKLGRSVELSVVAARRWRDHDTREQFTLGARPIAGSHLRVEQREGGAKLSVGRPGSAWKAGAAVLRQEHRDNGSGYFDYDREQWNAHVSWRRSRAEIRLSGSAARYTFPQQLIGFGIEPESRRKDEVRGALEANFQWTPQLALIAAGEAERSRSNDERSRFRMSGGYVGVRWDWDSFSRLLE